MSTIHETAIRGIRAHIHLKYDMGKVRLPRAICAAVADVLEGSHTDLDILFEAAGAPMPPPDLPHSTKWKTWLYQVGNDPDVDSLAILGHIIEEFMDLPPLPSQGSVASLLDPDHDPADEYEGKRAWLVSVLEEHGLRYFRGGRILPIGEAPAESTRFTTSVDALHKPATVEELLEVIVRGVPRAIHPLQHRRRGAISLTFDSEYDIQDLVHAQLRPWITDIRPEEFTPSYAGTSTRMDLLLPRYKLVLETKRIRDRAHSKKVGDELIIDIEHYRRHPDCDVLWCVIYDPENLIENPRGMISDLEGSRSSPDGVVNVRVFVLS